MDLVKTRDAIACRGRCTDRVEYQVDGSNTARSWRSRI
jgi:hypothetical protein